MSGSQMQITPEQGAFMALLVQLTGARSIVEVGVFTGYSSLAMALALPEGGRLHAYDIDEETMAMARRWGCALGWRRCRAGARREGGGWVGGHGIGCEAPLSPPPLLPAAHPPLAAAACRVPLLRQLPPRTCRPPSAQRPARPAAPHHHHHHHLLLHQVLGAGGRAAQGGGRGGPRAGVPGAAAGVRRAGLAGPGLHRRRQARVRRLLRAAAAAGAAGRAADHRQRALVRQGGGRAGGGPAVAGLWSGPASKGPCGRA
jgi:hypothetical protein